VVVHDLDIFSACVRPTKAQTELIIYADAMLPCTIPFQGFQPIPRRHPQIAQSSRDLQLPQLASCDSRDIRESPDLCSLGKSLGIEALERFDHRT
jgi:hypothetical protein